MTPRPHAPRSVTSPVARLTRDDIVELSALAEQLATGGEVLRRIGPRGGAWGYAMAQAAGDAEFWSRRIRNICALSGGDGP